jgi:hypothetical protein
VCRAGALDLEAAELYVRSAVLAAGARVLEQLLQGVGVGRRHSPPVCACGHLARKMQSRGVRTKTLHTILGPVRWQRSRHVCPECGAVEYAGDELLGVHGGGFSPGLRRLMTRAGSRESFAEAAQDLRVYGAMRVDAKDVERVSEDVGRQIDTWMRREASRAVMAPDRQATAPAEQVPMLYIALDGTGVPMRRSELANTKGKGPDGRAATREVKLGCCFTQTCVDQGGKPVRDPQSTSYVGAIEPSADFGNRLHAEAMRRGLGRARKVAVLSDGAEYNATIAREHFPHATHIIDFYHASQHLADFIKDNTNHPCGGQLHEQCHDLLNDGRIEELAGQMRDALPRSGPRRASGLKAIAYFTQRAPHMRYGLFRQDHMFVGSGVIEAGCKTLIAKRLKHSGMFWTTQGANALIAARCCIYSQRFEQFWEDQAA